LTIASESWVRICLIRSPGPPNPAEVDGVDVVVLLGLFVGGVRRGAWIPALMKAMSRRPKALTAFDQRGGLVFDGDVAHHTDRLMAGVGGRRGPGQPSTDSVLN